MKYSQNHCTGWSIEGRNGSRNQDVWKVAANDGEEKDEAKEVVVDDATG